MARFAHPRGVTADGRGDVFVTDSYNHLIRRIAWDGHAYTLAGKTEISETTRGCPPPCLRGVPGFFDGNLTTSKFYFPSGIAMAHRALNGDAESILTRNAAVRRLDAPESSILVTDAHRIRRVTRVDVVSETQSTRSRNRAITLAGGLDSGKIDGIKSPDFMRKVDNFIEWLEGKDFINKVTSITKTVRELNKKNIKLNITAVYSSSQTKKILKNINKKSKII